MWKCNLKILLNFENLKIFITLSNYFLIQSQALQSGVSGNNPEQLYASQLEQLTAMGFINREANLQGKCRTQMLWKIFYQNQGLVYDMVWS